MVNFVTGTASFDGPITVAGGPIVPTFDTVAAVQAATLPSGVSSIRTSGYYAAGDGGSGLYVLSAVQSADQGRIQGQNSTRMEPIG